MALALLACSCGTPTSESAARPTAASFLPTEGTVDGVELDLPSGRVSEPELEFDTVDRGPFEFELEEDGETTVDLDADVLFDTGSAVLKPTASTSLRQLLDAIRAQVPDARLEVEGHTDSRGDAEDNLRLSRERATAVKQWFVDADFAADRVDTYGRGESEPAVPDTTADGEFDEAAGRRNRRVVIIVQGGA